MDCYLVGIDGDGLFAVNVIVRLDNNTAVCNCQALFSALPVFGFFHTVRRQVQSEVNRFPSELP